MDRTTRRLCAAVHFDAGFCTRLYDEFLAEPCRAVPPSPGLDSAAVLREAAAAMARRRVRDVISLALLVALAAVAPWFLLGWLLLCAAPWFVGAFRTAVGKAAATRLPIGPWKLLVPVVVGVGLLIVVPGVLWTLVGLVFDSPTQELGGEGDGDLLDPVAVMVVVTLFAVFAADRLVEWSLATGSFREANFSAWPRFDAWPGERLARTASNQELRHQIDRIAKAADGGNVVVYRGADPFVGAGEPLQCWSMAIPLREKKAPLQDLDSGQPSPTIADADVAPRHRFTPSEMHDYVRRQFDALRSSLSLSPDGRLRWLGQQSVLIAAADQLLTRFRDHPAAAAVLPELGVQPNTTVPEPLVRELADNPVEWMRHFTRFQVESWDRELVVSAFLHLGCDNRMLYVEWNALVLYPIRSKFWAVDLVPDSPLPALRDALGDLLACPLKVLSRLAGLRPFGRRGGKLAPYLWTAYGSRHSIRELAADNMADNFFQDTDIERYRKILERHAVASMMSFLDSKGLSTAEFAEGAATIINNSGSMLLNTGSLAAGGNVTMAAGGASAAAPSRPSS